MSTTERFSIFLFCPLKNCVVGSYLCIEPVILQECIGHLSLARGHFQSHIPCGRKANQAMKENLVEKRMIVSMGCHLPTEHAQARISNAIILNKLRCLEFGWHNDLREIGQVVQIDTSLGTRALYETNFLS